MPVDSPPSTVPAPQRPPILDRLPDPPPGRTECSRRARQQLDLLLLAIEALDLGGSEAILAAAKELELDGIIENRVNLWRLRASNPLRRANQRRSLSLDEGRALAAIAVHLARRLTVLVRQLLIACEQLQARNLSYAHHFRLADYLSRFRAHFRARMNPRRAAVLAYSDDAKLDALALSLLEQLMLATSTAGMQRLWIGLFDGEVA